MAAEPGDFRIITMSRTREVDFEDISNGARSCGHHINAVRQDHGFVNVVGDKQDCLLRFPPDAEQLLLHGLACQGVQCAEGLVHEKQLRIHREGARDLEVRSVDNAVIQVALTTLRTGIGQYTLDDVLKEQETVSTTIGEKIDAVTEPWGVKVERVEMKNVEIPGSMQRAIAQEAEALREKRARLIKAQAELEAAEQLRRASEIIMQNPAGLELRRMQMITEVGAEQNTMTIVMMPSEFVAMARSIAEVVKRP